MHSLHGGPKIPASVRKMQRVRLFEVKVPILEDLVSWEEERREWKNVYWIPILTFSSPRLLQKANYKQDEERYSVL